MSVHLIRHAKAGDPAAWAGPDYLRPLSGGGRRQAKALVDLLAGVPIGVVLSSPTARCCATVEPLARDRGLLVELDDNLAEDAKPEAVVALLKALVDQDAVVCTHGELIELVLERLVLGGLPVRGELRWEKGSIWVFEAVGTAFISGQYIPPPRR
jgi:phosphohistidine phosphatase SixA